ncbi:MAG TPA: ABC transporter ATP-binding protein [Syntrophobacter fumaroxidans]|nr:ABC transporter ATP-binding protein [Syntrophobacter fumaroxidans]
MSILVVKDLEVKYGDTQVLWGLDLTIERGEFVALVGANGAGKTTFLKTVVGLLPAAAGSLHFAGEEVSGMPVEYRIRKGMAMVPEGRRLFKGMSVMDNLTIGAYFREDRRQVHEDLGKVFGYFPELERLKKRVAGDLSGGEQQMCAVGRALMASPGLLLVDEMSLGLAPVVVERLAEVLAKINVNERMSVLLVEQDVEIALELSSRGYVLDNGQVTMNGDSGELLRHPQIREAYLGLT